jgi:hypothetical protein
MDGERNSIEIQDWSRSFLKGSPNLECKKNQKKKSKSKKKKKFLSVPRSPSNNV